jgi:glycosyltransferase involved in cell wall biosynthesis
VINIVSSILFWRRWRSASQTSPVRAASQPRANGDELPASDSWHSFDRTPWKHPWLTRANLSAMRAFSAQLRADAAKIRERVGRRALSVAFVGNIANNLYVRAVPLRRRGLDIEIVVHPQDDYVMSHPCWEEFDGDLRESPMSITKLRQSGARLPEVPDVWQDILPASTATAREAAGFFTEAEYEQFGRYAAYMGTLKHLATKDVLLTSQCPYLALFSRRPYLATQMGGDIWYECSRNDAYGQMQRRAFREANGFLVSNPWSHAHARRYGMSNFFYLPLMLDQTVYSPGEDAEREIWRQRTGGSFFVLSTARLDDFYKGSSIGLKGFADFARRCPGARLIVLGWGQDLSQRLAELELLGIADRVLVLPIAGKRRVTRYLRSADCLIDQFVLGYYGATALEAMACGTPVIMRLEREQYDALCETGAPPVLDADTPEAVMRQLLALAANPDRRQSVAKAHRRWFLENHGDERWAADYENFLVSTAVGYRLDFRDSPLHAPLTTEERAYHAEELTNAPRFPSYS